MKKRMMSIMLTASMVAALMCGIAACNNEVKAPEAVATESETDQTETDTDQTETEESEASETEKESSKETEAGEKKESSKETEKADKKSSTSSEKKETSNGTNKASSTSNSTSKPSGSSNQSSSSTSKPSSSTSKPSGSTSKPSGSTSKPSGSTSSGSSSKPSKPAETKPAETKPVHQHQWVAQTKVVHHEATGHYETVTVQAAYDEPIYESRTICTACGGDITGNVIGHFCPVSEAWGYTVKNIQVGTKHHDAVTEQKWVQDSAAWDETVTTGYKCSCGATK